MGIIRTDTRLNAACGPPLPKPGRLAFVSQSGALCNAMLDWAASRHVGFSTVISTGVGDDIEFGEILDFLARDGATDSIMLYMEAVADARRFMSALRAAARVKPVVVMKAGRAAESDASLAFHTGSLVGGDDVFDAAMRRAGVLRIRAFSQLYSAAGTLGAGVRMTGRRLGIVMNAGGPGPAGGRPCGRPRPAARAARRRRRSTTLQLVPAAEHAARQPRVRARRRLGEAVRRGGAARARGSEDRRAARRDGAVRDDRPGRVRGRADRRWRARRRSPCSRAGWAMPRSCRAGSASPRTASPRYRTPEAAVDAIAALALFTANQEQLLQVPDAARAGVDAGQGAARRRCSSGARGRQRMAEPRRVQGAARGVRHPGRARRRRRTRPTRRCGSAEAVGFPVAMKILSPDIAHKTDVGGVRLGRADAKSVRDGYENMMRDVALARPDARLEGVLIEPMYLERHGRELMIGVVRDPVFGPAISFGLGGTMVEVIRDRAVALPPLNQYLARDLIRRTRASLALQPLRGAPAAAREAVEDMLLRVSEIVCELPDVGRDRPEPGRRHGAAARSSSTRASASCAARRAPAVPPHGDPPVPERPRVPDRAAGRRARDDPPDPARGRAHRAGVRAPAVGGVAVPALHVRAARPDAGDAVAVHADRLRPRDGADRRAPRAGRREQQIGVARYITLPDEETCEFAIVVSDEWQGKGIARQLFRHLIEVARERRLKVMTGITLRENSRMIDLSRALGFTTKADVDEPELVRMTLVL